MKPEKNSKYTCESRTGCLLKGLEFVKINDRFNFSSYFSLRPGLLLVAKAAYVCFVVLTLAAGVRGRGRLFNYSDSFPCALF